MRRHRFIVNNDLSQPVIRITDPGLIHQWREVLKLRIGGEIILSDGKGLEKAGKIIKGQTNEIIVKTLMTSNTKYQRPDILRSVTLYCAILKRDNFEWVVEKATEVGVAKIVPIITERTIKMGFKRGRLEKIIKEASEQCGRTAMTELSEPMKLKDAFRIDNNIKVFFDFGNKQFNSADMATGARGVAVFVGPEGGWSAVERKEAAESECLVRSLGPLTLRAETAAVIAAYVACNMKCET